MLLVNYNFDSINEIYDICSIHRYRISNRKTITIECSRCTIVVWIMATACSVITVRAYNMYLNYRLCLVKVVWNYSCYDYDFENSSVNINTFFFDQPFA